MQASKRRGARELERLSRELSEHWDTFYRAVVDRRLRSHVYRGMANEFTPTQLEALRVLGQADQRMGSLAHHLGLAESSVTRMIDRLAARGLVERRSTPQDRRAVMAGLTEEGRGFVAEIAADRRTFLTEVLEDLRPDERVEMVRLFERLSQIFAERRDAGGAAEDDGEAPGTDGGVALAGSAR
jgi:DNA-binding MarR family transcriptional regulator